MVESWTARCRRPGRLTATTLLLAALLLGAGTARAQEDSLTIAFFAPSVYFSDSVARAGFVSDLAAHLSAELGVPVEGVNLSSASQIVESDFAIVDGIYFGSDQTNPVDTLGDPLASAEGYGGTEAPLALIVRSSGVSSLAELAGQTLILPRSGFHLLDFVTAEILHGEISAEEFFGTIDYTTNIESALAAVAEGQADATLGFAAYANRSGLTALSTHGDAPLPVLVQVSDDLDDDLVSRVTAAIRGSSVSGDIDGFTSFDRDAVGGFNRRATRDRAERSPLMTRARSVTVAPGDIELPDVREPLVLGRPIDLILLPEMEEP